MSDFDSLNVIIGFVSPLIIAMVQQPRYTRRARALVTAIYSLLVGTVICIISNSINIENITTTVLTILVVSITTYKGLWNPTGATGYIEGVTTYVPREHDKATEIRNL